MADEAGEGGMVNGRCLGNNDSCGILNQLKCMEGFRPNRSDEEPPDREVTGLWIRRAALWGGGGGAKALIWKYAPRVTLLLMYDCKESVCKG